MSIRQDDDETSVSSMGGFSLRSFLGGMRLVNHETDEVAHSMHPSTPSVSHLSTGLPRTSPVNESLTTHLSQGPPVPPNVPSTKSEPSNRPFAFNLGSNTKLINELIAKETRSMTADENHTNNLYTHSSQQSALNASVQPHKALYSSQFSQPSQPSQPSQHRIHSNYSIQSASTSTPLTEPIAPYNNNSHALEQLNAAQTELSRSKMQLEESNQRLISLQRQYEHERQMNINTQRAAQEKMESYRRQSEQARLELAQLHNSLTTNKSAEQSLLIERDSQLNDMRQTYQRDIASLKEKHEESMKASQQNIEVAHEQMQRLSEELSNNVTKSDQLESELKRLQLENQDMKLSIPPTPVVPPSCDENAGGFFMNVQQGVVSVESTQSTQSTSSSSKPFSSALSADLSQVIKNAFLKRQRHGIYGDVVINENK